MTTSYKEEKKVMKKLWKIPNQTKCPICRTVFNTPSATMTGNNTSLVYVDGEKGTYEVDCPQCGEFITVPLDVWG